MTMANGEGNKGSEFDHSTLCSCMEILQWIPFAQLMYANKKRQFPTEVNGLDYIPGQPPPSYFNALQCSISFAIKFTHQ
jgi:hypothetical protein